MNPIFTLKRLASLFTFLSLFFNMHLEGCTGIRLVAKDGSIVHGRTLEFGMPIDTSIVFVPRGYKFTGTTPQGPGLTYKSKYAAIGAIAFNNMAILDGLNEKGLAAAVFYFPGFATYTQITPNNQSKALSPSEFAHWIITQFANVDEVKQALANVVIAPTVSKEWGSTPPPFHYIVYDKMGNCLVIEPIKGKLVTHENQLGVFTNSPAFDWHLTNLRNYINLTPMNDNPVQVDGMQLAPLGQGSGMIGLPGDFTPPSRFVRAAIFSLTALPTANANDAVFQAFHILNQFDIPVGAVCQKDGDTKYVETTSITGVRDPQSLQFYFKTYENQTIRKVDLNTFDFNAQSIKRINTSDSTQTAIDISSDFR
jgi:choloylglycine hydrolase